MAKGQPCLVNVVCRGSEQNYSHRGGAGDEKDDNDPNPQSPASSHMSGLCPDQTKEERNSRDVIYFLDACFGLNRKAWRQDGDAHIPEIFRNKSHFHSQIWYGESSFVKCQGK